MTLSIFSNIFNVGAGNMAGIGSSAVNPNTPAQDPKESIPAYKIVSESKGKTDSVDLSRRQFNRQLRFEVDMETNKVVTKIIDGSGREIRQIPDAQLQKISNALNEYSNQLVSDIEVSESAKSEVDSHA